MSFSTANKDYLDELRKMTMISGRLSEFHLNNLKLWPFTLYSGIDTLALKYDFSPGESTEKDTPGERNYGKLIYKLSLKQGTLVNPADIKLKSDTLLKWVQTLLWNEVSVTVFMGSEKVYERLY